MFRKIDVENDREVRALNRGFNTVMVGFDKGSEVFHLSILNDICKVMSKVVDLS